MSVLSEDYAAVCPSDPPELSAYVEHQQLKGLAPETIAGRSRTLRVFAAQLERPLAEATREDLRGWVAGRRDLTAPATQVTEIRVLTAFYAALVELGRIEDNPAACLRGWRVTSPRRALSLERVQELLAAASAGAFKGEATPYTLALLLRDRACLELLFATGMRVSEVAACEVVDLDLSCGSILVRRAKRGHSRRLPLPEATVETLRDYMTQGRPELRGDAADCGRLLLTNTGGACCKGTIQQLVERVARRTGKHTYPHAFRRTLATELVRAGTSLPAVQQILGHAHLTTTSGYVEVALEQMRTALELLDRGRAGRHTEVRLLDNSIERQARLFNDWRALSPFVSRAA